MRGYFVYNLRPFLSGHRVCKLMIKLPVFLRAISLAIVILGYFCVSLSWASVDIDNDQKADFAVWRPSTQTFYTKSSFTGSVIHREVLGNGETSIPLLGDIDGNNIADIVTWSPEEGLWSIKLNDGSSMSFTLGQPGDIPFLGDRDGDGKDDLIVRRPSEGRWYFLASASGYQTESFDFGKLASDVPVLGDYDEDGLLDFAIWREGVWYMRWSSDNVTRRTNLGTQSTDIMVPADYDGDGTTDVAMWRPTTGKWYVYYSSGQYPEGGYRYERVFGKQSTDIPVPADYDGDGKADLAIRRADNFSFYYLSSVSGEVIRTVFGKNAADIPALAVWQSKQKMLVEPSQTGEPNAGLGAVAGDVDGDKRADFAVWRPETTTYYTKSSNTGSIIHREEIGTANYDIPLLGNIDENDISDLVIWQPKSGNWQVVYDDGRSETFNLGQVGDYPFLADRDGDGKDDFIIRRPSEGLWLYLASGENYEEKSFQFGSLETDVPVLGDYDGDGKIDFAIWRDSVWYQRWSTDNVTRRVTLGKQLTDIMVPADYDGDGITDVGMWRPATGKWYIYYSSGVYPEGESRYERVFGNQETDIPVPADYDGDGKADIAFRRASNYSFYYLSSINGETIRVEFGKQVSDIPALAAWQSKQRLLHDVPADEPVTVPVPDAANQFYLDNVSEQIIQNRCIACHVSGGAADGSANLLFVNSDQPNYQTINQQRILEFLTLEGVTLDYFLNKASGGQGHVGGPQLPVGSEGYENLRSYLELLTGEVAQDTDAIWTDVSLLGAKETLRRAAIILTGAMPESDALQAVETGGEAALRSELRNLMQGEGFHQFVLEAVNDRLLTDKWLSRETEFMHAARSDFPDYTNKNYEFGVNGEREKWNPWVMRNLYGFAKAPGELVAYIFENDRPYTEVLTADYIMVNPYTNYSYRAGAVFDDDATVLDFKPGKINQSISTGNEVVNYYPEPIDSFRVEVEGENYEWTHLGLLNDPAFLSRYPSTATNRNRARARWTYFHFLGFDIERSSPRTTDPDALADTNNPTMNNSNCTSCHESMDPVAGAFQYYGDAGLYLSSFRGQDSLPDSYKFGGDSEYQEGDLWYRDMRAPGFEGAQAPSSDHSLQWLAEQIIQDDRFYQAAAKFWWPAIFGYEVEISPSDPEATDYQEKQQFYQQQSEALVTFAQKLKQNSDAKAMFVDMLMSPWFRATSDAKLQFSNFGVERVLTPGQLKRKTENLTGVVWDKHYSDWSGRMNDALTGEFNILYGGIDSDGVIVRNRDVNSVMSLISKRHALFMSCEIVTYDFVRDNNNRLLFKDVLLSDLPNSIAKENLTLSGLQYEGNTQESTTITLPEGSFNLVVSSSARDFENASGVPVDINLSIFEVKVIDNGTNEVILSLNADEIKALNPQVDGDPQGQDDGRNALVLYNATSFSLPIELPKAGNYSINVEGFTAIWGELSEEEKSDIGGQRLDINLTTENIESYNSGPVQSYRQKIAELMFTLWGTIHEPESAEVTHALVLLNQVYQRKSQNNPWGHVASPEANCNADLYDEEKEESLWHWGNDAIGTLTAWRVLMAYLLSDLQYTHE